MAVAVTPRDPACAPNPRSRGRARPRGLPTPNRAAAQLGQNRKGGAARAGQHSV